MRDKGGARDCRDVQCFVHLYESGARLGEIGPSHPARKVVRVVLVEVEDLVESLHVDCRHGLFGLDGSCADRIASVS